MLEINNLIVSVDNKEILHGINLTIPDGEVHALFGPNGSGKSVLIRSIMGYPEYDVQNGSIFYNNHSLCNLAIDQRVNLGIGVCEQRPPTIKGVKVRNLLDILATSEERKCFTDAMIKSLQFERFLDRNINDGLSGGEIKYSELFFVLITCPSFLLLDEPDSGVDPEHLKLISDMINQILIKKNSKGDIINSHIHRNSGLIVTHSASILDYIHVDKAHLMVNGQILCSGNPGLMMDQIRNHGYDYCIKCQEAQQLKYGKHVMYETQ